MLTTTPSSEVAKTLADPISKFCQVTLESLAYAGTGDVLKVQSLLAMCGEHLEAGEGEGEAHKAAHQGAAVIGLALVAMAEPLGASMASRALEHMIQVRRGACLDMTGHDASNPPSPFPYPLASFYPDSTRTPQ